MPFHQLILLIIVALNVTFLVNAERRQLDTNAKLGSREVPQSKNKYIRNVLFASRLWLTPDQLKKLNDLQIKGNSVAVVHELETFYRNLNDKTRASLRVQAICRTILSDELGPRAVDELIAMRAKMVPSLEFVNKIKSLFQNVNNPDLTIIQPLCVAAYENSHVPTANDPRQHGEAEQEEEAATV